MIPTYPSEKYELVNWDDEIPSGKIQNVPKHKADREITVEQWIVILIASVTLMW